MIFDVGETLLGGPDLFRELEKQFPTKDNNSIYNLIKDTFMVYYGGMSRNEMEFRNVVSIIGQTLSDVSEILGCNDKKDLAKGIYYDLYGNKSFLYKDTICTLDYMKKKEIELIIASDADAELLYYQLKKFGLSKYFSHYFISSEIKTYKPSTKFVNEIQKVIKEPLDGILFIGDSKVDVLTGKKLGVKTVLKREKNLAGMREDYFILKLKELKKLVSTLSECEGKDLCTPA